MVREVGTAVAPRSYEAECPVCGAALSQTEASWVLQCRDCRFMSSTLQADIGGTLHRNIDETARLQALEPLRRNTARLILDALEELKPDIGPILEVGCGYGWFLEEARARGHSAIGIEPDRPIYDAAKKSGLDVRNGYFPEAVDTGEAFDVIVFNDVLEHIPYPHAVLEKVGMHLNEGGHLVVCGPSADGFLFNVARMLQHLGIKSYYARMWQKGLPSPHLSYWKPDHLSTLSGRLGLAEVRRVRMPSVDTRTLKQRLAYDRQGSAIGNVFALVAIYSAAPLLNMLPADIELQIFVKTR